MAATRTRRHQRTRQAINLHAQAPASAVIYRHEDPAAAVAALLLIGSAKPAGPRSSFARGSYLAGRLQAYGIATTY